MVAASEAIAFFRLTTPSWCGNGGRPLEPMECVIERNCRRQQEEKDERHRNAHRPDLSERAPAGHRGPLRSSYEYPRAMNSIRQPLRTEESGSDPRW